jgi:hypothetical protein
MRASSFLTAAAFAVSLGASTGAIASNFSGVPDYPQAQGQDPTDPPGQRPGQAAPYDSPDFVVPPYEIGS